MEGFVLLDTVIDVLSQGTSDHEGLCTWARKTLLDARSKLESPQGDLRKIDKEQCHQSSTQNHSEQDSTRQEGPERLRTASEEPCAICFEPVIPRAHCQAKLMCGHIFHLPCIGTAFNSTGVMQCPVCRALQENQPAEWKYADKPIHCPQTYHEQYEDDLHLFADNDLYSEQSSLVDEDEETGAFRGAMARVGNTTFYFPERDDDEDSITDEALTMPWIASRHASMFTDNSEEYAESSGQSEDDQTMSDGEHTDSSAPLAFGEGEDTDHDGEHDEDDEDNDDIENEEDEGSEGSPNDIEEVITQMANSRQPLYYRDKWVRLLNRLRELQAMEGGSPAPSDTSPTIHQSNLSSDEEADTPANSWDNIPPLPHPTTRPRDPLFTLQSPTIDDTNSWDGESEIERRHRIWDLRQERFCQMSDSDFPSHEYHDILHVFVQALTGCTVPHQLNKLFERLVSRVFEEPIEDIKQWHALLYVFVILGSHLRVPYARLGTEADTLDLRAKMTTVSNWIVDFGQKPKPSSLTTTTIVAYMQLLSLLINITNAQDLTMDSHWETLKMSLVTSIGTLKQCENDLSDDCIFLATLMDLWSMLPNDERNDSETHLLPIMDLVNRNISILSEQDIPLAAFGSVLARYTHELKDASSIASLVLFWRHLRHQIVVQVTSATLHWHVSAMVSTLYALRRLLPARVYRYMMGEGPNLSLLESVFACLHHSTDRQADLEAALMLLVQFLPVAPAWLVRFAEEYKIRQLSSEHMERSSTARATAAMRHILFALDKAKVLSNETGAHVQKLRLSTDSDTSVPFYRRELRVHWCARRQMPLLTNMERVCDGQGSPGLAVELRRMLREYMLIRA
ncbi:hypothetical protein BZG36_02150 [Bifiguratus adelaidae]|uniref:RING-type domain-containing protein n=1 Tax=Bifiguratus adelaidae TaxID=1938954 RepID=A0A261Y347_9FUNG|nr:hypothetical protein BZG36_02150 [Bifiguratus adelaidae]